MDLLSCAAVEETRGYSDIICLSLECGVVQTFPTFFILCFFFVIFPYQLLIRSKVSHVFISLSENGEAYSITLVRQSVCLVQLAF